MLTAEIRATDSVPAVSTPDLDDPQPFDTSGTMPLRISILDILIDVVGPSWLRCRLSHIYPQLPTLTAGSAPRMTAVLRVRPNMRQSSMWQIDWNGEFLHETTTDGLLTSIEWVVNQQTVAEIARSHLAFHAGALGFGQCGVILPASSGSGKTTLTAALIAEGASYFSDEVAVVDPISNCLVPFAKSLTVKPGSVSVLRSRYPELFQAGFGLHGQNSQRRHLQPPDDAWPPGTVQVNYVVFPRYKRGMQTRLEEVSRAEAFSRLMAHSFSARQHPDSSIRQIIQLLQHCECYDLTIGDLDDAVSQLHSLVEHPKSQAKNRPGI